jgi:hypothetical protein
MDIRVTTSNPFALRHFQQYFSHIMVSSFSGEKCRSTRWEPPTTGKQLVSFINCDCESSAPYFVIYTPYWYQKYVSNISNLQDVILPIIRSERNREKSCIVGIFYYWVISFLIELYDKSSTNTIKYIKYESGIYDNSQNSLIYYCWAICPAISSSAIFRTRTSSIIWNSNTGMRK